MGNNCVCTNAEDEDHLFQDTYQPLDPDRNNQVPFDQSGPLPASNRPDSSPVPPSNMGTSTSSHHGNARRRSRSNHAYRRNFPHSHHQAGPPMVRFPSPNQRRFSPANLSEEEQIRIAKRLGLLAQLPCILYKETLREKMTECTICMCEYVVDEPLRCLPCLHSYHQRCIDEWLVRSFTCPDCCQPVEPALLSSFQFS